MSEACNVRIASCEALIRIENEAANLAIGALADVWKASLAALQSTHRRRIAKLAADLHVERCQASHATEAPQEPQEPMPLEDEVQAVNAAFMRMHDALTRVSKKGKAKNEAAPASGSGLPASSSGAPPIGVGGAEASPSSGPGAPASATGRGGGRGRARKSSASAAGAAQPPSKRSRASSAVNATPASDALTSAPIEQRSGEAVLLEWVATTAFSKEGKFKATAKQFRQDFSDLSSLEATLKTIDKELASPQGLGLMEKALIMCRLPTIAGSSSTSAAAFALGWLKHYTELQRKAPVHTPTFRFTVPPTAQLKGQAAGGGPPSRAGGV